MKSIQIKDSYSIWRPREMTGKILEACHNKYGSHRNLLHHERSAAKLLNKTYLSMVIEWYLHNIIYYLTKPLCSIIRTRKYLERGYHINAGQYVKMAMQLNELNLKDIPTLEDQLTGVDTGYFQMMIDNLRENYSEDDKVDSSYVIELVNKLF